MTKKAHGNTEPPIMSGSVGRRYTGGELICTRTGRLTSPFPDTRGNIYRVLRAVETWLFTEAVAEARARGDEHATLLFSLELRTSPYPRPQSWKDAAEEYLFGQEPTETTMQKNKYEELREAVKRLYYAAHWLPDRPVPDAGKLWEAVRDAAGFDHGHAPAPTAPTEQEARAVESNADANDISGSDE